MSDQDERFDDLKQLLRQGAAGAPADDLTSAAWSGGRRRARVRAWSVGGVGAAASVAAVVTAWSLGGGQAGPLPPADDASSTNGPTTQGPRYRITYDVVQGQAQPDGSVESWDQLAGTELEPVDFTVTTEHGVSSAKYPGPLGLGGPIEFGADHELVISDGCTKFTYQHVDVRNSRLVPGPSWPTGKQVADCERTDPAQPRDLLMGLAEEASPGGVGGSASVALE